MLSFIGVILLLLVFGTSGDTAIILLVAGLSCLAIDRLAEALEKRP